MSRRTLICIFLFCCLLCFPFMLTAQGGKITIVGKVRDAMAAQPVPYATVTVVDMGLWGITAEDGSYRIKNVPAGTVKLKVDFLGYETLEVSRKLAKATENWDLEIRETSLRLQDVVLTAKEGGELTSSSRIEKQALEHVQPASIRDVLQLLPGNITENPNLNKVSQLSIREIGSSSANAFGTAVVLDGATLSNDANMQVRATGGIGIANGESSAGGGVDARRISTDNIESIEIIRGIPSVEYGDLTSGAVVVKTRAGASPWQWRFKADPVIKQVSLGKGFSLGKKKGVMNVDADYALSYRDTRTPASAYRRFNFQWGYSNTFYGKFRLNAKVRAHYSDASNATDPDNFLDNLSRDRDRGISVNVNGRYNAGKKWLTNVEYLLSADLTDQFSEERTYHSSGQFSYSTSKESGENTGYYAPAQYYSDLFVYGRPVNLQARLTANLYGKYGKLTNKVLVGAEWTGKGNRGDGKVFDASLPPSSGSSNYRERSYKDIPFLYRYTLFAEDKASFPMGGTRLEVQAGVRFNGILKDARFGMSQYTSAEPRFNTRYEILRRAEGFRNLALRAGWGIHYKMPSMLYLYPEACYLDVVSFAYNDLADNHYAQVVYTTRKMEEEIRNPQLGLQKSENFEAGVEFTLGKVNGSVVYYRENMTGGYSFTGQVVPVFFKRYGYTWVNGAPEQQGIPSGKRPQYQDGNVYLDGHPLPYVKDTVFVTYRRPNNNLSQKKWGVEYTLDFPEIKAIRTAISVNGAYMYVETQEEAMGALTFTTISGGRYFPYAAVYAGGGSKTGTGNVKERFNANIRFVTHIPQVGMVVTLTAQAVFMDRTRYICEINGQTLPYYYDENGIRHSGADVYKDTDHTKYVNPLYIVDRTGRWIPFTRDMELDPQYKQVLGTTNNASFYAGNAYPFYGILNLRLTKEIGRWASVSFYANNFVSFSKYVREKHTGSHYSRNLPLYFGAEVKFTF